MKQKEPSSTITSISEKPSDSTPLYFGSPVPAVQLPDTATASPSPVGASFVSTAASTTDDTATMPLYSNASSSTLISASSVPITTPLTVSLSSSTPSSSVSAITTTVPATSASATEFATVPDSCSPEQDEVAAILARQCEKFLSCRAARKAQGREENERHGWVFGAAGFETTSSNKPVSDAAHIPASTAEQKYGDSKPCSSLPMIAAPLTSNPSAPLDSKSGSSLLTRLQPAEEEEPYFPPIDLLDSTIDMWVRVVGNKKTDQEVTEEGIHHFYEGINYFYLLSERLQVASDKYNVAVKASDDLEKMNVSLKDKLVEASRRLEDSKKEKERLEHELAGADNKITTLTGEKESLLKVQMIFHQKIFELTGELKEAGPAAIQKYKSSSLYRQELMEYAAPYMGKGVKLAIEKIKAKDPTFDPEMYGLEMYILPPEADDQEFSSEEQSDGSANQEPDEVRPSGPA
ncbi:hypothetical protein K7X08_016797 [Anisodus acutangulus]|uniref:Uncharacterized protein n=1 Tax=Anisodus acutangulus TaxID=402998 RepID=A0A9Q1LPS4_9SOLA|nr:hypothetical protein K7X08_016797 [Anisodus acutangulus]